jgi:group I intron endonuclease
MCKGVIYCAISPSNKKYYGFAYNFLNRKISHKKQYKRKKTRFYCAIRKYGFENFIWNIIETYENENKKSLQNILQKREKYWIIKDKTYLPEFGYNMTYGGDGGDTLTNKSEKEKEEIRLKKSKSASGKNNPMYGKKVYDIWVEKYGKEIADKKSEERKKRLSESLKGISHQCSQETKEKIRKKLIGNKSPRYVTLSKEDVDKIIDLYVNKKNSITQIQKINHLNYYKIKEILNCNNIEFIKIYKLKK